MVTKLPLPEKIKIPGHGKTRIGSVYIGSFGDGDLWIISPTKGGGVVVTHVPPREPVTGVLLGVESVLVQRKELSAAQISEHFKTSTASGQDVLEGIAMLGGEEGA
ncbi:hypothetical protein [Paraburkholderia dilworthii]|uniref:Uncharacterized protein n=1 Tax=Paraburkholderia dilworthii TaxID=948106 RepID=A0ABW9DG97_9BURK